MHGGVVGWGGRHCEMGPIGGREVEVRAGSYGVTSCLSRWMLLRCCKLTGWFALA